MINLHERKLPSERNCSEGFFCLRKSETYFYIDVLRESFKVFFAGNERRKNKNGVYPIYMYNALKRSEVMLNFFKNTSAVGEFGFSRKFFFNISSKNG